jgi:hypothetical protein
MSNQHGAHTNHVLGAIMTLFNIGPEIVDGDKYSKNMKLLLFCVWNIFRVRRQWITM